MEATLSQEQNERDAELDGTRLAHAQEYVIHLVEYLYSRICSTFLSFSL